MKKTIAVLLAVMMIFTFTGCKKQDEVPAAGGELTIYSPNTDGEFETIIPAFEEKYGIKVYLISAATGECISRIEAEKNDPQCDVLWGGMNYNTYLQYPGLWEPYVSDNEDNILENAYKNHTGFFTNYGLSGNSPFVVNVEKLAEAGLTLNDVQGYQDLIDHADKLKGKVYFGDPTISSSAWSQLKCMLYLFGEGEDGDYTNRDYTKGWEYVTQFVNLIEGTVRSSSSAVYKGAADGECIVGVTYEDPAIALLKGGATNVAVVYPEEGSNWTPCAASIVKNAPHLANAKLFIDFLISEEGQKLYATTTLRPVITSIPNTTEFLKPFSEISNVFIEDMEFTAIHKEEWLDEWKHIIASYK
ncbi:MAG: extracellular solute-binding protein [Erysipelotrichaceae bacterium]|nr:extracellular solute-binding protein [Erysipelotrichaceae bacterium]